MFLVLLFIGTQVFPGIAFPDASTQKRHRSPTNHLLNEGTIVMEDDVMLLETMDPDDVISAIEISSNDGVTVEHINGCFSSRCSVDLSHLSAGQYTIQASTANENLFSESIEIK